MTRGNGHVTNDTGKKLVEENTRRAYYGQFTEVIRAFQEAGRISGQYDAACFNLAMTALALFPPVFPQLTRMITLQPTDSPGFQRQWKRFLKTLAGELEQANPTTECVTGPALNDAEGKP